MPPENQNNPNIPAEPGPAVETIAVPWIKVAIIGLILPTLLIFFLIGAFIIGTSFVESAIGIILSSAQFGLSTLFAAIVALIPLALVVGVFALGIGKLFAHWNIPQSFITAFLALLAIATLEMIVVGFGKQLGIPNNFVAPEVIVTIGGAALTAFVVWSSFLPMGKLKTGLQTLLFIVCLIALVASFHHFPK